MSNDDLFRAINGLARSTPWLNRPAEAYATTCGFLQFAVLLLVGWWVARRHGPAVMAAALWAPFGVLLATAIGRVISPAMGWPLPSSDSLPHILALIHPRADTTSPSTHATLAGAAAAGLFLVRRALGMIAGVAALLMGVARVYVGLQYPSDAVAGLVLGAVVTTLGFVLAKGPLVQLVARLRSSPLRPLVVAG